MAQPWRDVMSFTIWEYGIRAFRERSGVRYINNFIDDFSLVLKNYHSVEKADLSLFPIRISQLKVLEGKIRLFLSNNRVGEQFKNVLNKLKKQAILKAGYLEKSWLFMPREAEVINS